MEVIETALRGVMIVVPKVFSDHRGLFMETWNEAAFRRVGIHAQFVQDNLSVSTSHTLRGLHYQMPHAQGKLVRVVRGAIFDVAVDLRRSSPTFGQWLGVELTDVNHHSLWIPEGCAHGFLVLSPTAEFVYKCTGYYAPAHEHTIRWDDPDLGIEWPLPAGTAPVLSARDAQGIAFNASEHFP